MEALRKAYQKLSNEQLILVIILILSLIVRLYYIYASPTLKLTHDEIGYSEMTQRLFDKGFMGYWSDVPNAFVTPGYPLFLALLYYITGLADIEFLPAVRTVQVIISIGSIYLVYLIAQKSKGRIAAGILAAVIWAVYPTSFMANNRILTEVLYTFLLVCYIYSVIIAFEKQGMGWHALSGGILGITVLVRPALAPFLAVPYIVKLITKRDVRVLAGLLVAGLTFCCVMTPWWVRNYVVFDKFIMFATQTGDPLLRGTDPYDVYDKYGPSVVKGIHNSKKAEVAVQRIKDGFRTNPGLYIKWYTVGKFSNLWVKPWGMNSSWAKTLHFLVFFLAGWIGVLWNIFDEKMRIPALLVVFVTLIQLIFIPIERYMYPLTSVMAVMVAVLAIKIARNRLDTAPYYR
jgi:4-amino-4-deoxy-L-arabinose transferase-like glycosyltransferase